MYKIKPISLRTAVFTPFIIVLIIMISLLALIFRQGYEEIANEQGTKLIDSLSETAQERIYFMLKEPLVISSLYADLIRESEYYDDENLLKLEKSQLALPIKFTKQFHRFVR